MQKNSFNATVDKVFKTALLLGFLLASSSATAFESVEDACSDADFMPLNESLRSQGHTGGESRYFKLEVPVAGLVTLDVAVPVSAEVEAKLGLFGRSCDVLGQRSGMAAVIEQTPSRLVAMTDAPGTFLFAVAAQDPRSSLGRYRLTAGFAAADFPALADPHHDTAASESDDSESEDELELEPNFAMYMPPVENGQGDDGESEDELELEPNFAMYMPPVENGQGDDGESEDELELEPNFAISMPHSRWPPEDSLRSARQELCRRLANDDHGDTMTCATAIAPGLRVTGSLGNFWGDDHDLFAFVLTESQAIEVATDGQTDTAGALFDRNGHLLAVDADGGDHDNFRIVKTLGPGLYFVRIEGTHNAEGPYALRLDSRAW